MCSSPTFQMTDAFAGRTGLGVVMGSKHLKAVAVVGDTNVWAWRTVSCC